MNKIKIIFLSLPFVLVSCSKKNNEKKAADLYRQAVAQLSGPTRDQTDLRRALPLLEQSAALHTDARTLALEATVLAQLGQLDESDLLFNRAISVAGKGALRAEILNNHACVLGGRGRQQDALRILDDLATDPHYLTPEVALFNKARILAGRHEFRPALAVLEKAILQAPEFVDAYYFKALLARQCGEFEEVHRAMQALRVLVPDSAELDKLNEQLLIKV